MQNLYIETHSIGERALSFISTESIIVETQALVCVKRTSKFAFYVFDEQAKEKLSARRHRFCTFPNKNFHNESYCALVMEYYKGNLK
jgi:hypothetical protein